MFILEVDTFKSDLLAWINGTEATDELVRRARASFRNTGSPFEPPSQLRQITDGIKTIDVSKLLDTILDGSNISGGSRYVACAILAAKSIGEPMIGARKGFR